MPHPLALTVTLVWGIAAGWVAAWLAHRFVESDDSNYADYVSASCDQCHAELSLADTAPHHGWACPHCNARLPMAWPIIMAAVVAGCVSMLFSPLGDSMLIIPFMWLVPVLVVAAAIDLRTFLIPMKVAWVGFFVGLASIVAATAYHVATTDSLSNAIVDNTISNLIPAFIGAAMLFGFLFLSHMVYPAGMGFGDVRFSLLLGLYLGWIDIRLPIWGLLLACLLGVAMGVTRRITAPKDDENAKFFPFGPGLVAGTLVAVWFFPTFLP